MKEKNTRGWLKGDIKTGHYYSNKNNIKRNMLRAATWITNVVIDYKNENLKPDFKIIKSNCVCKRGINNKLMESDKKYFIFVRFEEGSGYSDLSQDVLQEIAIIIGKYNSSGVTAKECLKEIRELMKEKYFEIYFSDDYKKIYETARKEANGSNINLNTAYVKEIIKNCVIKFD